MATTGQDIFNLAMVLIDEMTEQGVISDAETRSYNVKTPSILTILETELAAKEGLDTSGIITDLSANVSVSDYTARLVMPYGLATHLVLDENPEIANFFSQKFEEMKRKIPAAFTEITDVYAESDE